MFILRRQWIVSACVSLWLIAFVFPVQASEAQVRLKSKALAHYIMAVIHDLNGDDQEAVHEYQKAAKFNPKEPLPHLKLGAYYARLGLLDEALKQLKIVIKLQSDSAQAHYLLALIYSSQKKYGLAASEYELILKTAAHHNPANTDIHAYLAQLYYSLHKYPQAVEQLTHILQFQPGNVSALYLLGAVFSDLGHREKAKEQFRKVLSLEPDHNESLNSLAYMYAEDEVNLDDALKMIRKAIVLDPYNGAFYDTLGWVLFKKGFNAESLMALEKAQTYVEDPIIYEHLGDVYQAVEEPALARKFWLRSLSIDPKQPKVAQKVEGLNNTSAQIQEVNYNPTK